MATIKLTKIIVEGFQAVVGKPVTIFRDSEVVGLQVRVYPSGRKTFTLDYRTRTGQSRTLTLGTFPTLTVAQARELAGGARREVMLGGDPAKARSAQKAAPTVAQLCDRYLSEHVEIHNAHRTAQNVRRIIATRIKPKLGSIKVPELTREDVRKWHVSMKDIPTEANRSLAYFRKALSLAARDWNMRPDNPALGITLFKEKKHERFLSEAERGRLGEALAQAETAGAEWPSAIAAIRLLVFTGCRLSEIMSLRWEYVDWDNRCLRLPISKTGAKVVYLAAPAQEVLHGLVRPPGNPYVIYGSQPGQPFKAIHKVWYRIRAAAKLEDVRIHDLRHSFASVGATGGLSLPLIGKLLGHTQAATTQRYAHLADDPARAAVETIGAVISANMTGKPTNVILLKPGKASL